MKATPTLILPTGKKTWVRAFNARQLIQFYNANPSMTTIDYLLGKLPLQYAAIRAQLQQTRLVLQQIETATRWRFDQQQQLEAALKTYTIWSQDYKLCFHKLQLLIAPTERSCRFVLRYDRSFFDTYLTSCQCPAITLTEPHAGQ